MLVALALFRRQCEESLAVHTCSAWLEVVPKELEELGEVLREGTTMIDSKLLEESGRHEDDRVRVETARVRLVQVMLGKHLLNNQNDVP